MPLAGKQTGPQGAEPGEGGGGVEVEGTGVGWGGVARGLRLAAGDWGEEEGIGGARQAWGIGVKEMLTDTINVICLLPQEVDGSLYCAFVPSAFSPRVEDLESDGKLQGGRRGRGPTAVKNGFLQHKQGFHTSENN